MEHYNIKRKVFESMKELNEWNDKHNYKIISIQCGGSFEYYTDSEDDITSATELVEKLVTFYYEQEPTE